jgi:hypothetical protein
VAVGAGVGGRGGCGWGVELGDALFCEGGKAFVELWAEVLA